MSSRAQKWAAVALLVLGVAGFFALGRRSAGPGPEDTRAMARELAQLRDLADPLANSYANGARVRVLEQRLASAGPQDAAELERALALELLRSGRTRRAIELLERLGEGAADADDRRLRELLAIAWMRLGEQENCSDRHTVDSCLLPISGDGVHRLPEGSRAAIGVYTELLADDPTDLTSRWLLNVAHMTLGSWPDAVPEELRIEHEAFASERDVGRFLDRANDLGVDVVGLSGGVGLDDFDGDGRIDVLCSAWGLDEPVRLFLRTRDGFRDATDESGLEGITGGLNLVHADYDNDGDRDALILRGAWLGYPPATDGGRWPNSLLANDGSGHFVDATEHAGVASRNPTQTAAWGDLDGDGWLDLVVGNELSGAVANPTELFLNERDGTFGESASAWGLDLSGMVKGVVLGDVDNDGDLDLYASRLGADNVLFENRDGRFRDVTARAGVAGPVQSFPCWFWDHDQDGWLDLFVSGYGSGPQGTAGAVAADVLGLPHRGAIPALYRNRGDGTFEDLATERGVDTVLFTMGSNHGDVDGDGWPDFYAATGDPDFRSLVPNRMFVGDGRGGFLDATTSGGFGHLQKGHGIGFADLDDDGDQDVYAVMGGAYEGDVFQNALFENPGHGERWVALDLVGTAANRDAIGARVAVRVRTADGPRTVHGLVSTGGSFGSSSLRLELGLGDALELLGVEVTWPGSTEALAVEGIELDGRFRVVQGTGRGEPVEREPWPFPAPR